MLGSVPTQDMINNNDRFITKTLWWLRWWQWWWRGVKSDKRNVLDSNKDFLTPYTSVSLNGGTPNLHPKTISFRKTPWLLGKPTILGNPLYSRLSRRAKTRHLGKSWQTGATSWPGRGVVETPWNTKFAPENWCLKILKKRFLPFLLGWLAYFFRGELLVSRECSGSEVLPTCWVCNWVFISSGGECFGESHQIINKGSHQQAIMFRGVHQLRLVVSPSIYHGFSTIQTVVVWDFWTINSITRSSFSQANWMKATFEKIPFV